jgi:hypothetical protein
MRALGGLAVLTPVIKSEGLLLENEVKGRSRVGLILGDALESFYRLPISSVVFK